MIDVVMQPLYQLWYGLLNAIPGLVAAILILIVGYIVGVVAGRVVRGVLTRVNLDKWAVQKAGMKSVVGDFKLSDFLGLITKWYVFILFLPPAASVTKLSGFDTFLLNLALWIPNVIVAVVLALVGLMAGDYVAKKVRETKGKASGVIALGSKVTIWIFTAFIVLDQIGVKIGVAQTSFLIVLGGIMLAIALMLGIGFGLAMKDEAKKVIKDVKKRM